MDLELEGRYIDQGHKLENQDSLSEDERSSVGDDTGFLHGGRRQRRVKSNLSSNRVAKILAVANILLTVLLVGTWITASQTTNTAPEPPYSPLRESGHLKYVNKKFKPERIFQMEPSDEVDAAWNITLGPSDGIVRLPKEMAVKLPETTEIYYEPGYYIYGVNVFHQLHCLNIIRRSFYPERYFPNATKEHLNFHRYHCIDFLRQSIMCHGDVSMTYWWNKNYTYTDEHGQRQYTDDYLQKTPKQRAYGSWLRWDTEHQCRDLSLITEWVEKYQLNDDAYKKYIINKEPWPGDIVDSKDSN